MYTLETVLETQMTDFSEPATKSLFTTAGVCRELVSI